MLVPISWLKDYVDIPADMPAEALAERLTLAGLEVGKITYIGVPQTRVPGVTVPPSDHLVWDRQKIVLGKIVEVKSHPNADRGLLHAFPNGAQTRQLWYEDLDSLALKIQFAIDEEVGGIGFWALTYERGDEDFWQLIADYRAGGDVGDDDFFDDDDDDDGCGC